MSIYVVVIVAFLFLYLLWVHYLAVMDLKRSMMKGTAGTSH